MPTLHWIGKEKVINHHLDVPYRTLKTEYAFGDARAARENLIIHGDNLEALKALLPQYEGRVKVVCIDPPYNTGNESWVYNDNVNDPKITKWLGQTVGREGEDLSRHDKWLCMMYPRLKLLHKLLRDDGAIFIHIGDDEQTHLHMICNEIFGVNCFIGNIAWQRTYSPRNDSKGISSEVEWIMVYGEKPGWQPNKLARTADMDSRYDNPDQDPRPWTSGDASAPGAATHTGMVYAIQHPITGKFLYPSNGRHWTYGQDQMLSYMNEWAQYELKPINDQEKRAEICGLSTTQVPDKIDAILLVKNIEEIQPQTRKRYQDGTWPLLFFTNNGTGGMRCKRYLDEVENRIVTNLWPYDDVGHTDEASKELKAIFGKSPFDTPKPTRLIERILQISSKPDSAEPDIILDSFAGSGTTAHAVLKLNRADGGNRKFILIEMEDYAETITAERVRRVMSGYGPAGKEVPGAGGGFSYLTLGPTVFMEDGSLNPEVPDDALRRYVWYAETKATPPEADGGHPYYLGSCRDVSYYFFYRKGGLTTLDYAFLKTIERRDEQYVIYADACALDAEYLKARGIQFKKIPRDIPRC